MQLNVLNIANCMRGSNESAAQCFSSLSRHKLAKPTGYILILIEKVAMAVCYISLPFLFFFFFFSQNHTRAAAERQPDGAGERYGSPAAGPGGGSCRCRACPG